MNALAEPLAALPAILPGITADASQHDRDGSFPFASIDRLRSAGILALTVPAALGGGGGAPPANLGSPLAELPRVQEAIGQIEGLIAANSRIAEAMALASDAGQPPSLAESGALKVVLAENAMRAVELCTLLAGNHAHARTRTGRRASRRRTSGSGRRRSVTGLLLRTLLVWLADLQEVAR